MPRGEVSGRGKVLELGYYDRSGRPITLDKWCRLSADQEYKRVVATQVGPYLVSTVWLGLDHAFDRGSVPVIFETMIFATGDDVTRGLGPDLDCYRYSTEAAARTGHDEVVTLVRATTMDVDDMIDDQERRDTTDGSVDK